MTSPKRVERETVDVAKAVQRMIRAVGKRVAGEDVEDLQVLVDLAAEVERQLQLAVTRQRLEHDRSWAQIGRGLGITKQAAQQRFGRPTAGHTGLHLVPDSPSRTS